ncbi:MAG: hypothetical protein DHS20C11_20890 [Lysobacteraceae bacterium]|nr:MAG: hypothetical protein DHS20C11_20890 [Xanthomonadaceae bacterium]
MDSRHFANALIATLILSSPAWSQVPNRPDLTPRPQIEIERIDPAELQIRPLAFGEMESLSADESALGPMGRVAAVTRNHEMLFTGQFFPDTRFEMVSLPSGQALGSFALPNLSFGNPSGASSAVGEALGVEDRESVLVLFDSCLVALFRWHLGQLSLTRFLPGPPPYQGLRSMRCIDIAQAADGRYFISTTEQVEGVIEDLGFVSRYDPETQSWQRKNRFDDVTLVKGAALAFDAVRNDLALVASVGDEHKLIRTSLDLEPLQIATLPATVNNAEELVSFAGLAAVATRMQDDSWSLLLVDMQGDIGDRLPFESPIRALALQSKATQLAALSGATIWMLGLHNGAGLHRVPLTRSE